MKASFALSLAILIAVFALLAGLFQHARADGLKLVGEPASFAVVAQAPADGALLPEGVSAPAPEIHTVRGHGYKVSLLAMLGFLGLGAVATQAIDTPERPGKIRSYPLAAATKVFAGTLGALDAAGNLVPAANTAGLRVMGRVEQDVDNTVGAAGALFANVAVGVFRFANSGTDAVDADDKGKICFVEDDNTVSETGSTQKVKAGRVVDVDSDGVWVDTAHAQSVPSADTITGAADLTALKGAVLAILQAAGLVK